MKFCRLQLEPPKQAVVFVTYVCPFNLYEVNVDGFTQLEPPKEADLFFTYTYSSVNFVEVSLTDFM